jgi:hypothetical protein
VLLLLASDLPSLSGGVAKLAQVDYVLEVRWAD